jgi:hypothetical protein
MTTTQPQPTPTGVHIGLQRVVTDLVEQRVDQHAIHGFQHHLPDGTGEQWTWLAEQARNDYERARAAGELTWRHVLFEEIAEAFAESDPATLRHELIQSAAVAVQWVQTIDHHNPPAPASKTTLVITIEPLPPTT